MLVVMQNESNGKIVRLKSGFDFFTFFTFFFGLSFLPSLFRKNWSTALKLVIAQYLGFIVGFYGEYFKSNFFINLCPFIIFFGLSLWYYLCCFNLDKKIKKYEKRGFYPVKFR